MTRLTQLADKFGTDKGSMLHNYTEVYPKYLPAEPKKCLEIGVRFGPSLRMWAEYFPTLEAIYGIDNCQQITIDQFKAIQNENPKFKMIIADQSKRGSMDDVAELIGPRELDFILDDGSHDVDHQQLTLVRLFGTLKSGGLYIIEDLTDKVYPSGGWNIKDMIDYSDATVNVLDKWRETKKIESPHLTWDEQQYLDRSIDRIELDLRPGNNSAFIWKK